ncbi:MAG: hypothetical protein HY231_15565 [Acidobacteria bacterium]|nr:hypothetical protein [Acidobacteriota bacterium]
MNTPRPIISRTSGVTKFVCLMALLFFGISETGLALDANRGLAFFIHEVWRTENGLPQNNVRAILQTQNGYIWIATEEGLARFDGRRFTVFDKQNTAAIKSNAIQVLFEDAHENLWIGTDKGLVRWKNQQFTAYSTANGLLNDNIQALLESREGDLWIGTLAGLYRMRDEQITAFNVKDGLPDNSIRALFQESAGSLWISTAAGLGRFDGDRFTAFNADAAFPFDTITTIYQGRSGDLWFGSADGLLQFKDGRFTLFTTRNGLANNKVWSLREDRDGNLWIGTDGGLNRWREGQFTLFTTSEGLADNTAWSIYEDREGSLWIGTPGGLSRWRAGRFATYTSREGLSNNVVQALLEDREGNLWVGTEAGGLNLFKDKKFVTLTTQEGLVNDMAWTICEGHDGSLWIGTQGGLSRLKNGKMTNYTVKDGLAGNLVRALCEDHEGNLWIGTPAGLTRLKDGRCTTFRVEDGLSNDAIGALHEDRDGNLWIGTLGGLTQFKDGRFTIYTTKDGLSDDSILALQSDSQGGLWIGTRAGGVNYFHGGRFITYALDQGLSDNEVRTIAEDREGAVWIGTRRGGLNRLVNGQIKTFTTKDGLFDDCVYQILEDSDDNFWMSCAKGIFRVKRADLNDYADGKIAAVASVVFGMTDGMLSRECNGGQPAGGRSVDGKLWFPTTRGIAMIDPQQIALNGQPPPVVIEQVIADDKSLAIALPTDLSAGLGRIEFHFTALSFVAPTKIRFKYQLEGFDRDWIEAGNNRVASYTSIPPGHYKFQVLACNNDGVWNETGAAFNFYLQPHVYQTYWFYGLLMLLGAILALALYRFRIGQVRAQFAAVLAERNRLARDIHDTLAQGFVGIGLQLQAVGKMLSTSPQAAQQHLDLAQKMVNHSLAEARRTVWNLRAQALEDSTLAMALAETVKQMTVGTAVATQVKISGSPRPLASSVENNLLRIGQEALTNALKHGKPKAIRLELSYEAESVRLRVEDDGCGFDPAQFASSEEGHFGLLGMRERLEGLKGELQLHSQPGVGTTITAVIPAR